jgi:hypothetical protein
MSSLLELIAQRRRASAARRLGPPPSAVAPAYPSAPTNGHGALPTNGHNGHAANGAAAARNGTNGHVNGSTASTNGNGHAVNGLPDLETAEPVVQADVAIPLETPLPRLVWPPTALVEPEPEPEPQSEPEPAHAIVPPRYESWLPSPELISLPRTPLPVVPMPVPTPVEPAAPSEPLDAIAVPDPSAAPADPGFLERSRMRRRARYLRRLREIQMRDIGGFAIELYRYGRDRPEIVRSKIESATLTERELRAIQRALDGRVPLRELRVPGIGGACASCGSVHGSQDRFCANCGRSLLAAPPDGS